YLARFPRPERELREALARVDADRAAWGDEQESLPPSSAGRTDVLSSPAGPSDSATVLAPPALPRSDGPSRASVGTLPHPPGYEVLRRLGRGGMGVVYEARDTRLGRRVALKFLPRKYARNARRLEQFRREAAVVSALNHPFICTLYDVGEHRGRPFLVMERIEGQTLRALVGRRPPLGEVLRLARQVAQALHAAKPLPDLCLRTNRVQGFFGVFSCFARCSGLE